MSWKYCVLVILFTSGCQSSGPKHEYGQTDYVTFHNTKCRVDFSNFCVELDVVLLEAQIRNLVSQAKMGHVLESEIVALRNAEEFSRANKVAAIGILSGSYSTVNGNIWDGSEKMAIFVLESGSWVLKDTVEIIYDPV